MPKFSIRTLTTGASALVVQLAMLMILCFFRVEMVEVDAGQQDCVAIVECLARRADQHPLRAAIEVRLGAGRVVARPVQSITRSTPSDFQSGSSFIELKYGISRPPMTKPVSFALTSSCQRP